MDWLAQGHRAGSGRIQVQVGPVTVAESPWVGLPQPEAPSGVGNLTQRGLIHEEVFSEGAKNEETTHFPKGSFLGDTGHRGTGTGPEVEKRGADAPTGKQGAAETFTPHHVWEKQKLGPGRGGASEGPTANQWPSLTAWAPQARLPPSPED